MLRRAQIVAALQTIAALGWVSFEDEDDLLATRIVLDSIIDRVYPFLDVGRIGNLFDRHDGRWDKIIPAYINPAIE